MGTWSKTDELDRAHEDVPGSVLLFVLYRIIGPCCPVVHEAHRRISKVSLLGWGSLVLARSLFILLLLVCGTYAFPLQASDLGWTSGAQPVLVSGLDDSALTADDFRRLACFWILAAALYLFTLALGDAALRMLTAQTVSP